MKNLNKTIDNAVAKEIDRLLKPFNSPASVWDCYFCTLEELQREFPAIDRWKLRISLAIHILDRHLTEGEEEQTMRVIYDHAIAGQQAANVFNGTYKSGVIDGITCLKLNILI